MTIETQLNDDLKTAMKAKDKQRLGCVRQVKSKMQETVNAKGFEGEVDDGLWQKVIGAYVKNLKKGIEELAAAGERSVELRSKYEVEIAYLDQFLPKMMGEEETRGLVKEIIGNLGIDDPKQMGRVMGAVMKDHKGRVDPALVRKAVEEALGGG